MIAEVFGGRGEVINADSVQVYRGMNIGSAKPPPEVLKRVPHHLLDILEPNEQFDAGFFVRSADALVRDIHNRGNIPVISGGTAYYLKNFIFGLPTAPKADPAVRRCLKEEFEARGLQPLLDELRRVDPPSAERIAPGDTYRILRALEVYRSSGTPLSAYPPAASPRKEFDFLILGLYRDREDLNRRIDERVDLMFSRGLVEEVKGLAGQGYGPADPGMRGIGYREFFQMREAGCMTLKDVRDLIKRNSRRYAKRQMTFFRSFPGVTWIHPEERGFFEKYA